MCFSSGEDQDTDVMLHVALFKGSNCGVVDAVIAISFCMCAVENLDLYII